MTVSSNDTTIYIDTRATMSIKIETCKSDILVTEKKNKLNWNKEKT